LGAGITGVHLNPAQFSTLKVYKLKAAGSKSRLQDKQLYKGPVLFALRNLVISAANHILDLDKEECTVGKSIVETQWQEEAGLARGFQQQEVCNYSQQALWQAQSKQSLTWRGGSLRWVRWPRPIGDGQRPARRTVAEIPNSFQLLLELHQFSIVWRTWWR
jgi:hypothetical protein